MEKRKQEDEEKKGIAETDFFLGFRLVFVFFFFLCFFFFKCFFVLVGFWGYFTLFEFALK